MCYLSPTCRNRNQISTADVGGSPLGLQPSQHCSGQELRAKLQLKSLFSAKNTLLGRAALCLSHSLETTNFLQS